MSQDTISPAEPAMSVSGVAMADLADELAVYRQTIFKVAKRLGIQPTRLREPNRGNQMSAVVTERDAAAIRAELTARRNQGEQNAPDGTPYTINEGMFYLIQLEPDLDPNRFKVGF